MVIFGGFDGNFLDDMHYASFKSFYISVDIKRKYSEDIARCVTEPCRSDAQLIPVNDY